MSSRFAHKAMGRVRRDATPLLLYCRCGAAWLSTPLLLDIYAKMLKEFSKAHEGPGHGLCDAKTAARARRRAEATA